MTLLTQREAATLLKLSERTLERWRVAGDGPKQVRLGRSIRNFLTDQEAMGVEIKKHRTASANGWEFPLLSECREAWAKRYGLTEWDTNINDWGDEEEEEQPKPKST